MPLELDTIALLTAVAATAGFIDAIAGGGGLLSLPALLLAGLTPAEAIATNKLQGAFGAFSAAQSYRKAGMLDIAALRLSLPMTALGAAAGAATVSVLDRAWLETLIPILLLALAIYVASAPRLDDRDREARLTPHQLAAAAAFPVGFYDGVFGPGAGSFYALALVLLGGRGLIRATAETKALNFTSNVVSLAVFIAAGHVVWAAGLPMAIGQAIGARIGARAALAHGARLIRPVLALVSAAVALKLLLDPGSSAGQLLRSLVS